MQKCAKKVCDAWGESTVSEWQMIIWNENLPRFLGTVVVR